MNLLTVVSDYKPEVEDELLKLIEIIDSESVLMLVTLSISKEVYIQIQEINKEVMMAEGIGTLGELLGK